MNTSLVSKKTLIKRNIKISKVLLIWLEMIGLDIIRLDMVRVEVIGLYMIMLEFGLQMI